MHKYLQSIGFKQLSNRKQEEILIKSIIDKPFRKRIVSASAVDDTMLAELSREYAPGVGIKVYGQYNNEDEFEMDHYFPYVDGRCISLDEECVFQKRMDSTALSGLAEDSRVGVSLIFYMNNSIDCLENGEIVNDMSIKKVALSALSTEGAIIMPTVNSMNVLANLEKEPAPARIVKEEKEDGENTPPNIEFALNDMELTFAVNKRAQTEDLFSVVETTIIPYGMEAEVYKIIGIIAELEKFRNNILNENVYLMKLVVNDIVMDLCINENDLNGEPAVGRRFIGIVWLQGCLKKN